MRLTTKISLAFAFLLVISLGGGALTVWGSSRFSALHQQSDLAHRSYQRYLSLSSHTYQLFKQLGDSLLLRESVMGLRERELLFLIKLDLVAIDRTVELQQAFSPEVKLDDAGIATDMAELIEFMLVEYQYVVREINRSPSGSGWRRTAKSLDARLDDEFESLLEAALTNAKFRATKSSQDQAALAEHYTQLAVFFAVLASFATLLLVYWMQREIKVPLRRLVAGAEALEAGDTEHRLALENDSVEFSAVAGAFNQMALKIDERQRGLGETNSLLEQAVQQRTVELERALERVTDLDSRRKLLLADVSHELRTPLTIVRGEADLALRGQPKSEQQYREALRVTKDAAEHMTRLTEDLLFVARAASNQVPLQSQRYDLHAQLQQLLPQLRHLQSKNKDLQLPSIQADTGEYWVNADPDRIRQVVIILVENALNYGQPPWSISLTEVAASVRVTVSNRGNVLSEEEQEQLFDRFYRGSNASEHYGRGQGLGLPVAQSILKLHDAEIRCESSEEFGTRMFFDLQLVSQGQDC